MYLFRTGRLLGFCPKLMTQYFRPEGTVKTRATISGLLAKASHSIPSQHHLCVKRQVLQDPTFLCDTHRLLRSAVLAQVCWFGTYMSIMGNSPLSPKLTPLVRVNQCMHISLHTRLAANLRTSMTKTCKYGEHTHAAQLQPHPGGKAAGRSNSSRSKTSTGKCCTPCLSLGAQKSFSTDKLGWGRRNSFEIACVPSSPKLAASFFRRIVYSLPVAR